MPLSKQIIKDKKPDIPKVKLSTAEKKQIAALIRQAKGDGKKHTAQQTIPYEMMYPDGICRLAGKLYSKSIEFSTLTISLHSRTIRRQPLKPSAIFTIPLTAP